MKQEVEMFQKHLEISRILNKNGVVKPLAHLRQSWVGLIFAARARISVAGRERLSANQGNCKWGSDAAETDDQDHVNKVGEEAVHRDWPGVQVADQRRRRLVRG